MTLKKHYFVLRKTTNERKMYAVTYTGLTYMDITLPQDDPYLVGLTVLDTKKQAEEYRDRWNEEYKRNGTYAW